MVCRFGEPKRHIIQRQSPGYTAAFALFVFGLGGQSAF